MLIQEALNLLTPQLTALGWVEFFGGVTRRVTMGFPNAEDGITQKSFPVSCSITDSDCNQNQRYTQLTPDSSKKSVLYWEVTQGLTDFGAHRERETVRVFRGAARLVGWLNTDKLGVNECNTAAKAMRSILPILYTSFENGGNNSTLEKARINFRFSGEEIKDKAIFDRYDYGKNPDSFLLHPYDFFAVNVSVEMFMPLCNYSMTTGTPILCTDYSRIPD